MNAVTRYGLLLGLTLLATASFAPAPRAARQPAAVAAIETWTIPGAGRTPGQNNTFFVSDLALTNVGSATANLTITFVGPGGLPEKPVTLAPGATTAYRDILNALWSATGLVGALSVESDQPLVLRARTYNTAATGTFGVALPVYASQSLLSEGSAADSIWVQQSPGGTSGFRTNIGVVFPDAGGGDAVVTFYDAADVAVGSLTYSSVSAGFQQRSTSSVAPAGLPVGRAQITVLRGHAAGYAVGVDNVTGDTSLYPFEDLPAGVQDVVVSGVARLTGRNNTFFRTDARFYNPTAADVVVTAHFHAVGSTNPAPQNATLTVPAGRIVEVTDVLGSILNAPVGSGGAVRFIADQPIAILARTSNVDPASVQPGTFGAQQHPVPLASYLSSADAGAVVTGIRQDSGFRTNIGFAAGPDGAAYNLTLKNAQGGAVAVTTGTLGAFGWAQPSIADLFPGTTIPADATLVVQVTNGAVDVYDASLDNASGDLVVTPMESLPVDIPSSASIGPAGGSIQSDDGRLTLKVPAGALTTATALSIAPTTNTAPNALGSAYTLSPPGVAFSRDVQIVLDYSRAELADTGPGALGIATEKDGSWFAIIGGSVDTIARKLIVPISSTNPGPTTAAGNAVAKRARASGRLGPYYSVQFTPDTANVVEGDKISYGVTGSVGPSSTTRRARGFFGLATQLIPVSWTLFVQNVHMGNATVGTVTIDGVPIYTAPQCVPPASNPVSIKAIAEIPDGSATILRAQVMIIPKRWYIDVKYVLDRTCADEPLYSYHVERSHELSSFELNNRQVANFSSGQFHERLNNPATWCPGVTEGTNCDQPRPTDANNVQVTDVTGALLGPNLLQPVFLLTVGADFPNAIVFEFVCHGTRGDVQERFSPPMGVTGHHSGTASFVFFPYDTLRWELPRTPGLQITGESVKAELHPKPCP